ncbi:hypothetical protein FRC04_002291 [Tulasnella sp. 424]|nr:hypothetical protein FRC04_002291 [Tulasnella sp. 424]KAG8977364.1 hypothetical protein FRC05_001762 [Tulasnella sp. 425]
MKSLATSIFAFALATTPVLSLVVHPCPLFIPAGFPNPFAATAPAVNGTYLEAIDQIGVLVAGQGDGAFTYGSDGPLGLWGAGPTANGCPGYAFLNAEAKTSAYYVLTWGATSTTNWNATAGGYLTALGAASSSDFLACKKADSDTPYVLILKTAAAIPLSLESSEGDVITSAKCVSTKILVTHAPGFQL